MTPAMDFTRSGYRRLLLALTECGFRAVGYEACNPSEPHLILRHDIDFCPVSAVAIGEIEAELGLRAHYFFQTDCPFYSVKDPSTAAALMRLCEQGHEIGLHFDAKPFEGDCAAMDEAARTQCDSLARFLDRPVDFVSFHRPTMGLVGRDEPIGGRNHAYMPRYVSEMGYCSDSRGRWRFGPPLAHKAVARRRALQLLTHPIWWAHDDGGSREKALARLCARLGPGIETAVAEVVTGYDPATGCIFDSD